MKKIKQKFNSINLNILSRERDILMGIGILWIVFFHMGIRIPENLQILLFVKKMGNIGVDMFLFLSGIGLYYSYSKLSDINNSWKEFYKRRFWRIVPATMICLIPWFTYLNFLKPVSFARYLMDISSLSFWWDGNNRGRYIAMIIITYLLYPFLYHTIDPVNTKKNFVAFSLWGGVFVLLSYIIKWNVPEYYQKIELALSRFPVFFFGCFIAPEIKQERKVGFTLKWLFYGITAFLIYMTYSFPQGIWGIYELNRYAYGLIQFGLLLIFSEIISKIRFDIFYKLIHWMGQHSLEIYLTHTQILTVCTRHFLPVLKELHIPHSNIINDFIVVLLSLGMAAVVKFLEAKITERNKRKIPVQMRKNPDQQIMFVRVLAVFMIVLCHILQFYGNFLAYWFNVGVEIFFIISGLLYGQKDITDPFMWICRQWRKILVPYWIFSLAAIFAYYLFAREHVTLYGCVGILLACRRFPGIGHLWFISYILFLYLMTPLMQWAYDEYFAKLSDNKAIIVIIIFTGVLRLLRYYGVENYEESRLICYYAGYFLGRRYWRKNKVENNDLSLEKLMTRILFLAFILTAFRGYVQYNSLEDMIPYWSEIIPFIHSLMGFGIFWLLYYIGKKIRLRKIPFISIIDCYSFEIYLVHHIFILGAGRLNCMKIFSWNIANYVLIIFFIVVASGLLHFMIQIFNTTHCTVFFNKEEKQLWKKA